MREFILSQFVTFAAWAMLMLLILGTVKSLRRPRKWWSRLELKGRSVATIAAALVSIFVATAWMG